MLKMLLDDKVEKTRRQCVLLDLLNAAYLLSTEGLISSLPTAKNFNTFWQDMQAGLDSFH